jgi:hypothetical protein
MALFVHYGIALVATRELIAATPHKQTCLAEPKIN